MSETGAIRDRPSGRRELTVRRLRAPDGYPRMNEIANAARGALNIELQTTVDDLAEYYAHIEHCDTERDLFLADVDGTLAGYGRVGWFDETDGTRVYEEILFVDPAADSSVFEELLAIVDQRATELAQADSTPTKVARTQNAPGDQGRDRAIRARRFRRLPRRNPAEEADSMVEYERALVP